MTSKALELLRSSESDGDEGYVSLQSAPYRGHHLLVEAVLAVAPSGGRVFEGGVSSGYLAAVLIRAGLRVDGHELDPVAAVRAQAVCERVYVGDLQQFDADELEGTYDVLLFGDTLEHVADPAAVLRRLATRLTTEGALVVSVPNVANWAIRLSLLAGRFRYTDRGILDRTHLRFYTRATLIEMIESAGFEVQRVVGTIPVPGVRSAPIARVAHVIGNLWPSLLSYTFVVTATLRRSGPATPR